MGTLWLLYIPQTQTCAGQVLPWVGQLPACRGSGWPGSGGQGTLARSWATRPQGQRGRTLCRGSVSRDGCRMPPGLGGAGRALVPLEGLVQLWNIVIFAAGDMGEPPPGAGSVPATGSGASGRDGGGDPNPGL